MDIDRGQKQEQLKPEERGEGTYVETNQRDGCRFYCEDVLQYRSNHCVHCHSDNLCKFAGSASL